MASYGLGCFFMSLFGCQMKLVRTAFRPDGIFGRLYNDHGVPLCYTLEHSYAQLDGSWLPKIPLTGQFKCVRGEHKLHNGIPFETFEITGVTGHTNLLFHAGNYDKDSEGCVLVGRSITIQADSSQMLTNSKHTFEDLMNGLTGVTEFTLTVENAKPT